MNEALWCNMVKSGSPKILNYNRLRHIGSHKKGVKPLLTWISKGGNKKKGGYWVVTGFGVQQRLYFCSKQNSENYMYKVNETQSRFIKYLDMGVDLSSTQWTNLIS